MNKKGIDGFYVIIFGMILLVMIPVSSIIMRNAGNALIDGTNNTNAISSTTKFRDGWIGSMDALFVTIFFTLWIGAILLAFFVNSNPLFLVAGILIMIFALWGAMAFADGFVGSIAAPGTAIGSEMTALPKLHFIAKHYAEINLGMFVIYLIILYVRYNRFKE